MTPAQAATELGSFKAAFRLVSETPAIFQEWERLATTYGVQGKQAHDARLVAVVKAQGIGRILTFNRADFSRYATGEGIMVVDPVGLAAPSP